ncbi:MAG TPA: hypothetical protein EYQ18_16480 [Candidatus Handelsmanbacteria bacterium]|nr:hypothetical protein [Candidatus Handelsmanbacteria bacterium]
MMGAANIRWARWVQGGLCLVLLCLPASAQLRRSPNYGLNIITSPASQPLRPFIRRGTWPGYWNYGGQPYSPTTVSGRSSELYDRLGTHLLRGYPLVSWRETRSDSVGLQESSLTRENYLFEFFGELVVASDSYSDWNFSVTTGDNIRTILTPLTLRSPRWQGVRIDAKAPHQGFTMLLTRGALRRFSAFDARRDLSPVLAYGGHYSNRVSDVLTLGATLFNQHQVDVESDQGSFINGTQPYQMQAPSQIAVRIESDADDFSSVAGVYGVALDLKIVGADGVVEHLEVAAETPVGGQRVGEMIQVVGIEETVDYIFNLPPGAQVVKAIFRADVTGDYRIAVRQAHAFDFISRDEALSEVRYWPSEPTHTRGGVLYPLDFKPGQTAPYFTVARAEGEPGLNRRRIVSFEHGIPSGKTLIGTDFKIVAKELQAEGEIVYNIEEQHFPFSNDSLEVRGAKKTKGSWAYTLNLNRSLMLRDRPLQLGGELFRMDPDYSGGYDSRRGGTVFFTDKGGANGKEAFTQEFPLVEDNDDDDRYPDDAFEDGGRYASQIPGHFGATPWAGVFPGLDVDGDQTPDNDRDRNGVADWHEPFLHYDSDPSDFVYGIDFNNNTQPDYRENDDYADYPIRKDQRGIHTFASVDKLGGGMQRIAVGYYDMSEIAGGGEARSLYARIDGRWRPSAGMQLELHDDIKLVDDTIRDNVYAWATGDTARIGPNTNTPLNPPPPDPLAMRNSLVNTAYVHMRYQPADHIELRSDLIYFLNRQGDIREDGVLAQVSGSYSELAWVTRGSYRHTWNRFGIWAAAKFAFKEGHRGPDWSDQSLRFFGPIVRTSYHIMEGMSIQWGMSGLPLLPLRLVDGENSAVDYEERKMVLMLNGRTEDYQGSVVNINTGIELYRRDYDQGGRERDFANFGIFLEVIIGN